jgi:hypothetical protein
MLIIQGIISFINLYKPYLLVRGLITSLHIQYQIPSDEIYSVNMLDHATLKLFVLSIKNKRV